MKFIAFITFLALTISLATSLKTQTKTESKVKAPTARGGVKD